MKDVSTTGHTYHLTNHGGKGYQTLQFIEKTQVDGQFVTVTEGTTNEEVILCLIDRIQKLNTKMPCRENSIAITKLEEALLWLNKRTAERLARNVEGTPAP